MTKYTLKIKGLNLDNLLNILYSRKIAISNIKKEEGDLHVMSVRIKKSDYLRAMSDRVFDNFDVCVVKRHGLENFLFRLFSLSGAIIGTLFSILVGVDLSGKVWDIDININGEYDAALLSSIEQTLLASGVQIGKRIEGISFYDLSQEIIRTSSEISTATVEKDGTKLTVKVYLISSEHKSGDLFSIRNGIVKDVLIGTGEPAVKVGDVVKEGDLLIKADKSGNAVGSVLASVYYMSTVMHDENVVEIKPTGRVERFNSLSFFGLNIGDENKIEYKYKLLSTKTLPFNNFFLPIFKVTKTYIELKECVTFVPFENVEEKIKNQAKNLAMQNVNSACQIVNIDYNIIREGSLVKVDCFVETIENIVG